MPNTHHMISTLLAIRRKTSYELDALGLALGLGMVITLDGVKSASVSWAMNSTSLPHLFLIEGMQMQYKD
jgi:hypothetical protein